MRIHLNGRDHETPEGVTVLGLLETLGLAPGRVAVEQNGAIVPRDDYQRRVIRPDDRIEVVHFVGGG